MILSAVSAGFSPALNVRARLGEKVDSACKEFKDDEGGILSECF